MDEEKIVREEAQEFCEYQLGSFGKQPVDLMKLIKNRSADFYAPENKAVFLDEVEKYVNHKLVEHRNDVHNGHASETCQHEKVVERLLFYIDQEMKTLPIIAQQITPHTNKYIRKKVFVSYSRNDAGYLKDIQRHFRPFYDKIELWDDSKILPGQKWKEEVEKAINETKVAILLLSTDFLGSDFIANNELPPLLRAANEDGAVILIIIIRPCLFEEFPKLNQYQALNLPSRPVVKMDENSKEELFVNLVRQTKRILEA